MKNYLPCSFVLLCLMVGGCASPQYTAPGSSKISPLRVVQIDHDVSLAPVEVMEKAKQVAKKFELYYVDPVPVQNFSNLDSVYGVKSLNIELQVSAIRTSETVTRVHITISDLDFSSDPKLTEYSRKVMTQEICQLLDIPVPK